MLSKFNPTGTHVHKGFLKVRIDLYPDIGNKTYAIHHVQVPVFPSEGYQGEVDDWGNPIDQSDYDKWFDGLPRVWQLNPCLCHFVKVDPDTGILELQSLKTLTFDKVTVAKLDDALIEDNITEVRQIMKTKLGSKIKVSGDEAQIISDINARLVGVESIT